MGLGLELGVCVCTIHTWPFNVGVGDSDFDPHTNRASSLASEPSPQPTVFLIFVRRG